MPPAIHIENTRNGRRHSKRPSTRKVIVDVTTTNFEEEWNRMLEVVEDYGYVTIDTEFPGLPIEPYVQDVTNMTVSDWNYVQLRDNVNQLKLIQLGIAFCNVDGKKPDIASCWQFNFVFDLERDVYAEDAILLLQNAGIDFERNRHMGLLPDSFAEQLMTSGLVLNDYVQWITFHGLYDFAYLLRVLTNQPLPQELSGFWELLNLYFPRRCDIKFLLRDQPNCGLAGLAKQLGVDRTGASHQGGSDALLTADVFFALKTEVRDKAFDDEHDDFGGLFGLSNDEHHGYSRYYTQDHQFGNHQPPHLPSFLVNGQRNGGGESRSQNLDHLNGHVNHALQHNHGNDHAMTHNHGHQMMQLNPMQGGFQPIRLNYGVWSAPHGGQNMIGNGHTHPPPVQPGVHGPVPVQSNQVPHVVQGAQLPGQIDLNTFKPRDNRNGYTEIPRNGDEAHRGGLDRREPVMVSN